MAEQSVRLYLMNGSGFSRDPDGFYRNLPEPARARDIKPVWLSRACFFDGAQWAYRHEVTPETLRGSGSAVSTSFAVYMGVDDVGKSVELTTPYGPLRINRTTSMTTFSTLRLIANAFSAAAGDYLFLRRADENSLSITYSPASKRTGLTGFSRLALECGLDNARDASLADICRSVGLEPDSSASDLEKRFERRMESALIPFIPASD